MITTYAIVHFWPAGGGFGMRMNMLADVLASRARVVRVRTLRALGNLIRSRDLRNGSVALLIYTSLLAPLAALLRLFRPALVVYYLVRGDEVTYTAHARRRLRARVARVFQRLLAAAGCRFVFASDDLREVFSDRLGEIPSSFVLPNTLGRPLPATRPFDGRIALVGDFGSVKNIEAAIAGLSGGKFRVDLYGNRSMPEEWARPWLVSHGPVDNLTERLRESSLVVLSSVSEGFPNVLLDALQAGCAVLVHRRFPFRKLPVGRAWRFEMDPAGGDLRQVAERLLAERRDFKADNRELIETIESDWRRRVWEIFAPGLQ